MFQLFTSFLSGVSGGGLWKWVALLAAVFSIVAASSGLTYSKTKSYFVQQGDFKVSEIKLELDRVRMEFQEYIALQNKKVHDLEVESAAQAQAAQTRISAYRSQLSKAKSDYEKLLAERNETPGQLSTSAVDTINAKTFTNLESGPGVISLPALPETSSAASNSTSSIQGSVQH